MTDAGVLVVGAGISGVACAGALHAAGVPVRVLERGRVPGGRMASRRLHDRYVDLGASYLTASEGSVFAEVVAAWHARGLAQPWTREFAVADADGLRPSKPGPQRWSAPGGLRSLVVDLASGLDVRLGSPVARVEPRADAVLADGERYDAVVLAMPDPQARRLLPPTAHAGEALRPEGWEPAIAVVLGWAERRWPAGLRGVFVNDSPVLSFLADDGDRRGDGAAVLVAHTTAELARQHLENPDAATPPVADEVRALLGIAEAPEWTFAHRWSYARPTPPHPEPYLLAGPIGVCGDGWGGASSVGAAWTSGDALGRDLAARLGHAAGGTARVGAVRPASPAADGVV
ncbi:MAG: FAD-dependent oxidoreductase [Micrococcales bacterium]|nr:FAD-dependent oxidoreductase [Micrococcales bacterium]